MIALGVIYALPLFSGSRRQQRWIVQGFVNGICHACRRRPQTGVWEDRVISRRSDRALIRSLKTAVAMRSRCGG